MNDITVSCAFVSEVKVLDPARGNSLLSLCIQICYLSEFKLEKHLKRCAVCV